MNGKIQAHLSDVARDGNKITFTPEGEEKAKTLWAGLGNRSGLHSFAYELMSDKWKKSGERFQKRLAKLPAGLIVIHEYRNKTRDRGGWVPVRKITLTA